MIGVIICTGSCLADETGESTKVQKRIEPLWIAWLKHGSRNNNDIRKT